MRNKIEFEQLVYEKADILSAQNRRHTVYKRCLSTAAAITVVTAAIAGSSLLNTNQILSGLPQDHTSNFFNADNSPINRSNEFAAQSKGISNENAAAAENEDAANESEEYSFDNMQGADDIHKNLAKAEPAYSVKVTFYNSQGNHFELTDTDKAQRIISELSKAEQVKSVTDDTGEYLGKITTETSNEEMSQIKEYIIYENTATVSVNTHVNDDNSNHKQSYSLGTSEQFLKLCEEYLNN